MKINPHRLRHLTIVALLGLAAACDDGNGGPTNNPSGSGGARATGGRGGGGGSATGGSGGMASSVTPVGQIAGNSDAGAATSVMVDAQATANNNTDPAKPADASVSDIGSNGMMMAGNPEAEWTIFVYGHADHNLSPSMVKDLGEMSQAKLSDKVQVVALVDYDASLENDSENFPTGTFWYRIVGDGQPPKEIAKGPELDLDSPSILASAVHQAFTAYPAKRYGLILWDHGGAWIAGFGGDTADGKKEGEGMAVESVANALREAVRALGLKGEKPLEFITFDTCLMGGAEELAAFQDLAKVYTANAEIDFGDGLDYTKTLNHLVANPNTSAIDLGKAEATIWDAHHVAAGGLDTLFRSHAVWDTAKTPKIVEAMKDLNKTISDAGQTRSIARALTLSAPEYFAGSTDESSVALRDLGNVLLSLKAGDNGAVANAANRVLDEIKNARLGLAAGELRKDQAGLHVFGGPAARLTDEHMQVYPILSRPWEQTTGWGQGVLAKLRSAAPKQIDKVSTTLANSSTPTEKAATLTISSPSKDTVYVEGVLLQDVDKGDDILLGTIGHGFVGPGDTQVRWMGQATYLVASPKNLPVSVEPWSFTQEGQAIRTPYMAVQGVLAAPDEEPTKAHVLMNSETGIATHIVIETDASSYVVMTLAELAGMGEATFSPTLTTFNFDKETMGEITSATGVTLPASGQLQFRREAVPPGKYMILGYAEDFWGNGDFDGHIVEVSKP